MAQGRQLDDETIESIRMAYVAHGGKVRETARALGVSTAAVRKYGPHPDDDFARVRTEKIPGIIAAAAEATVNLLAEMAAVQIAYLRHLASEQTIKETGARDAVIVFGTVTDKVQLLTGKATERIETRDLSAFTDEQIGRLAAVAAEVAAGTREP